MPLFFKPFNVINVTFSNSVSTLSQLFAHSNVFISKSRDIFRNLAFEDWLFENYSSLAKNESSFLLLWYNSTAAVIGKHQNPWRELWLGRCIRNEIPVARRKSGGGTVIHDIHNLNISFISHRRTFNRTENMNLIRGVLKNKYSIESQFGKNYALNLATSGFKISGTAAKVGSKVAYHHCTLLIDSNLDAFYNLIRSDSDGIQCNATSSIPATIENLKTQCSEIEINQIMSHLSVAFLSSQSSPGFAIEIEPNEHQFAGIDKIESNYKSWDWIYGKTPKFKITSQIDNNKCHVTVSHGLIDKIEFDPLIITNLDLNGVRLIGEEVNLALNNWYALSQQTEEDNLCKNLILNALKQAYF